GDDIRPGTGTTARAAAGIAGTGAAGVSPTGIAATARVSPATRIVAAAAGSGSARAGAVTPVGVAAVQLARIGHAPTAVDGVAADRDVAEPALHRAELRHRAGVHGARVAVGVEGVDVGLGLGVVLGDLLVEVGSPELDV